MSKLFVAGATGVIGRVLVPLLIQEGHRVVGMTRRSDGAQWLESVGAEPVIVDALDREGVAAAISVAAPDAIIHQLTDLAGRDFGANNRLRIEGTKHLVEAAQAGGVRRMVAQSLAFAYAPGPGLATEETTLDVTAPPPRRSTIEGVQALEQAVATMPEGIILRYGLLYGPGTWYARTGWMAEQVQRGEVVATDDVTSFMHVWDAAQAAIDALTWPPGVVNIVDDEPAAGTRWLPVYAELLGAPPPQYGVSEKPLLRGASNAKARREMGWEPRYPSWRTGFQEALD